MDINLVTHIISGALNELSLYITKTSPINKKDLDSCENILDGYIYILPNSYYNEKFGVSFDEFGITMH